MKQQIIFSMQNFTDR